MAESNVTQFPLRQLIVGFVRLSDQAPHSKLTMMQAELSTWARKNGYLLGAVWVERPRTAPNQFEAMVEQIQASERRAEKSANYVPIRGVVVPSLDHFGTPPTERIQDLAERTGTTIHAVGATPHDMRD